MFDIRNFVLFLCVSLQRELLQKLKKQNIMIKNIFIIIFLLLIYPCLCAQTIEEKYSLGFHDFSWRIDASMAHFYIDSTQVVNGKHPLQITSRKKMPMKTKQDSLLYRIYNFGLRGMDKAPFKFNYRQDIVLPDFDNKNKAQLVLNSKCHSIQNIYLKVTCFDENEKIVYTDSVDINKNKWGENRLSFILKNTRMMSIEIVSDNDYILDEQIFWADRLKIKIGKTNFNNYVENQTEINQTEMTADKCHIHPLSFDDENSYSEIKELQNKKIIGIGESMHGSEDIKLAAFHFMKSLILNNSCTVILFEGYMDGCLKWDLYTQGITPENTIEEIIEDVKVMGMESGDPYRDFFTWLRKYNSSRSDKVRIFGINGTDVAYRFIMDYFYTLQKSGININALSEILQNSKDFVKDFDKIDAIIQSDQTIKQSIGDKDYEYLMYVVNEIRDRKLFALDQMMATSKIRDKKMCDVLDKITSLYLDNKDMAVVFAHSLHLDKQRPDTKYRKSLGTYIHEKYKNQYFCVSLQTGKGTYTQDADHWFSSTFITDTLEYPENKSFEKFCLNAEPDYFYFPASALPANIYTLRLISRGEKKERRQFKFLDLKNRFDAYVFLRHSTHLQDMIDDHTRQSQQDFLKKMEEKIRKLP
jgi:erythromycin esterase-like protein